MIPNNSPWLKQLNRTRQSVPLPDSLLADVAIVGGGIAGIMTAFFTLRETDLRVILLEADKVAHGATGHNAGQLTSYFERPLADLVSEFGVDLALDGQRSVESAWGLIDQVLAEAKIQTPIYRFTGYAGIATFERLIIQLENNALRRAGGLLPETLLVAGNWAELSQIPDKYLGLYSVVPQPDVLALLETDNPEYIALHSEQKGCMNSALFTEEVLGYLVAKYGQRFSFFESSPVKTIQLMSNHAVLKVLQNRVITGRVVLCTNGFENFTIQNMVGEEIDTAFHHAIAGRIGYMSGYLEPLQHPPTAISYHPRTEDCSADPTGECYFYLTRRPHDHEGNGTHNLVCTGGPEKVLPNQAIYSREDSCSEDIRHRIDVFLRDNYQKHPGQDTEYAFCWHGLMGYTPNGVRRIGVEPCHSSLLYNLGCNGVGILPAIFGGQRIAEFLQGKKVAPSIFDPLDQRCPA